MKQINILGKTQLKPRKSTIDFLLAYSKNLGVVKTKAVVTVFSKN